MEVIYFPAFYVSASKEQLPDLFFCTFAVYMPINSSNRKSLGALFEQYREPFILFARSYVKDIPTAEDIYMDAFMSYWEKRNELPEETNIPAYILTSIKNKALNFMRNQQTRNTIQEEITEHTQRELAFRISTLEACHPNDLFSSEIKLIVQKTLQELPEQTRKIFLKSRKEAKSNKEIASELGISSKTVEFHLTKALKLFRARLKDYLPFLALIIRIYC